MIFSSFDPTSPVRREMQLHAWHDPVATRPAATILLLRDSARGPEVLMTRRSMKASFAPGAYVFPGGVVDATDYSPEARSVSVLHADQSDAVAAFAAAAVREAHEELGVLLASPTADEKPARSALPSLERHPDDGFFRRIGQLGLSLRLDELRVLARWITDRDLPKRFDTLFFVARMPEGQTPTADESEQFEPTWITPSEALTAHQRGGFEMIFPTIRTLQALTRHRDVSSVLAWCGTSRPVWTSCPRAGLLRGEVTRFSEDESAFGELELVAPDGRVLHTLDWQHEVPVRLLKHVQRLTAPNPGRMTGPGTNTYIIGTPGDYLVIDPGPDDPDHIRRIAGIVGTGLKAIVLTHAHIDHAPGAAPLQALCGAPILGRATGPLFDPKLKFVPERELEDGERLTVADSSLRVLHTPGHVSNHICLLMEEDGLLFSGDHILNGSTTVITPPDGDMRDYVAQLHRLEKEPFHYILPAHGHVIAEGKREVRRLIAHRQGRENKVLEALRQAGGPVSLDSLVVRAYDDVDPVLHPVAKRSLLAHLLKLRDDGVARQDADYWRLA
jgi:recombination protein RecT